MKRFWKLAPFLLVLPFLVNAQACEERDEGQADRVQRQQQETLMQEATAQTGMPAIKNFRERKMLKDILELRDQNGVVTYTYLWSDMKGKLIFFCNSIGYGIPYATQYTNPSKTVEGRTTGEFVSIPQADPNGLFSPTAAEGTWILCADPSGKDKMTKPVYVEPRVVVSPFKLPTVE